MYLQLASNSNGPVTQTLANPCPMKVANGELRKSYDALNPISAIVFDIPKQECIAQTKLQRRYNMASSVQTFIEQETAHQCLTKSND